MAIDRFTFVPQQEVMQTYAPIDFGTLGRIGAVADARRQRALSQLEGYYDDVLKVNALPAPEDVSYVKQKRTQLQELLNEANATPNVGMDPVKTLDFVRKAREIHGDPGLAAIQANYDRHQQYLKNKQEAAKKEWALAPEQTYDYENQFNSYIQSGFGSSSLGDPSFQFGMDVHGEAEKLFNDMDPNEREYMLRLSTDQGGYAFNEKIKSINDLDISNKTKAGLRSFIDSQAGSQLKNRYKMQVGLGQLPKEIPFVKYAVDYLNNTGLERTFKSQTRTGQADAFNRGFGESKLLHGYLEPVLMTESEGSAVPFTNMDEFSDYSDKLDAKIKEIGTKLIEAKQPGAASSSQIQALEQEKARLSSEFRNLRGTWETISKLPGDIDENFAKYTKDNFKPAQQSVPFGKEGIITDVHNNPHKTAAYMIQNGGLTNYAKDIQLIGAEGEVKKSDITTKLQEGKIGIKNLVFDRDNNPILNIEVLVKQGYGEPDKKIDYQVKDIPADILLNIANDNKLLADNFKNEASQQGPSEMGKIYLQNAKDHERASRNIRHGLVHTFVNKVSSDTPETQGKVTFDLGAVGIPGVSIKATRDGEVYSVPGYPPFTKQGLIDWISDNIDYYQTK